MRDITEEQDFTSSTSTPATVKALSNPTSSASWSRFKDPRIVRVSRAFGGKDRHSKVFTVRGLRDRRVRLSVPTAIQLYDLQDRLGLNQPSKVVDWLLNAAKHEIDELPPLQFPVERFSHENLHQDPSCLEFGGSQSNKQGLKIMTGSSVRYWDDDYPRKYPISKDVIGEKSDHRDGTHWARNEEQQFMMNIENHGSNPSSSLPSFLGTSAYNGQVFSLDPSNLTLSQPTRKHGLLTHQTPQDLHNISLVPMQGSNQILVYQSGILSRHESHFSSNFQTSQLSITPIISAVDDSNTAQPVRPSHFSVTANLLPKSQNNEERP